MESGEPLAQRAARGGIWIALGAYTNIGVGFVANLALTRLLAPEHFGIFALGQFFFALFSIRPKIGIGPAFAQRGDLSGELVGTHLALDLAAAIGSLLLAALAAPLLRALGYSWEVVAVALALTAVGVLDALMLTAWILLDRELQFGWTSLLSSVIFPLSYLPAFWLALHGGGFWSLVAQNATNALLLLVAVWWVARRRAPRAWGLRWRFDRSVARELLRFGATVGAAYLAGMLVAQADNFLVGTLVGVATLGFYDRAYRIAQWPAMLVTGVVTRVAFYTYARVQDDPARLQKALTMSLWVITTLALPLALGIFIAAPDLVMWLYGERWLPSALFLRLLVAYAVIRPVLDDSNQLFVAVGRPRLTVTVAALMALTLLGTGAPLTLRFGAIGTCAAVGLTWLVGLGLTYRFMAQVVALPLWRSLGLPALAAALALAGYAALAGVFDGLPWPSSARALAKLGYAAAAYFAATFALQPRATWGQAAYVWRLLR